MHVRRKTNGMNLKFSNFETKNFISIRNFRNYNKIAVFSKQQTKIPQKFESTKVASIENYKMQFDLGLRHFKS